MSRISRVRFVKFKNRYIDRNEMIRSGEKIFPKYCLINEAKFENFKDFQMYLKSLKYKHDEYFSCHFVIDKFGKIYKLMPISEMSYHTKIIKINMESIGINVLTMSGKFNSNQKKSLKRLVNFLNKKVHIYQDLLCSQNMEYYTTHRYELDL